MSKQLFDDVSIQCSRTTTRQYSTSFSLGIFCLDKSLRNPIYSVYGFVRFADEIVDTFHNYNKAELLNNFKKDTYKAIDDKISLNPILNSFQCVVNKFGIDHELIDQFLNSMEMDLHQNTYNQRGIEEYIYGSAEVVGLMCLRVFCNGDDSLYNHLKPFAMKLGSAFQKINFLRDLNADFNGMGRTYFPGIDLTQFSEETKLKIEEDIEKDFHAGLQGIKQLPRTSRFGVYIAYIYYMALFKKIKNTPSQIILRSRIRIHNMKKFSLLASSFIKHQLNLI